MMKHIIGMGIWQALCLFISLFAGEYFIVEPNITYRYDRPNSLYVYPGRMTDWHGNALYSKYESEGASRHFTWIFLMFTLMQIFNMFPARKVHDEFNIFAGIFANLTFILIVLGICAMQVVLT
jgi:hypothetical protein